MPVPHRNFFENKNMAQHKMVWTGRGGQRGQLFVIVFTGCCGIERSIWKHVIATHSYFA